MIVADADLYAAACQFHHSLCNWCLAVVIREEHLGLDGLGCLHQLIDSHGVGLIARQESNVDILDGFHLWDILCIASNVDAQAVEGEDIAVVTSLRVELFATGGGVIGRYRLEGDVVGGA